MGGSVFAIVIVVILLVVASRRKRYLAAYKAVDFSKIVQTQTVGLALTSMPAVPLEIKRSNIEILHFLGKGNFGEVSKGIYAKSSTQKLYVAAKTIFVDDDNLVVHRNMLRAEAALMAQFNHENIVSLIGVVTVGQPELVVLEFCGGGALDEYLTSNVSELREQLKFATDCAKGMAYLASLRYIHRDLASRNVLLTETLTCKIADFGLSRVTVDKDYYRSRGGPLPVRWTAPEALDESKFSEQSDVWSFGVLLWEIWSRADMPYKGWDNEKVWAKVLSGYRLESPIACPREIYAVMMSAWDEFGKRPTFGDLLCIFEELSAQLKQKSVSPIYLHPNIFPSKSATASEASETTPWSSPSEKVPGTSDTDETAPDGHNYVIQPDSYGPTGAIQLHGYRSDDDEEYA